MDYTQNVSFTAKDSLASGDANKKIRGSEMDAELSEIAQAIASKADSSTAFLAANFTSTADAWLAANTGMVGQVADLVDPNADRLIFWDDSASAIQFLTLDPNTLVITGQTISAIAAGGGTYGANQTIDHTTVNMIAGSGLTGGGTIDQSRTFNIGAGSAIAVAADSIAFDLTGLTAYTGPPASNDYTVMYDTSAAVNKKVQYLDMALPVTTLAGAAVTLAAADMNTVYYCTSASAVAVTLNTSVGAAGNVVVIYQSAAGQVTVSGTATVNAAVGKKTRTTHSVIILLCVAANTWVCFGDAAA